MNADAAVSADPLLRLRGATLRFGGLTALQAVDLDLGAGDLVGLIGPNGAGKTTLFNLVTGLYRPSEGRVTFRGRELAGLPPHAIARLGISRTFQNIRLWPLLSVLDNVRAACAPRLRGGAWDALWRGPRFRQEEAAVEEEARALLRLFGLEGTADWPAGRLPYGDQRRLEIVRALATRPALLLLDEPAAGMNPTEKTELMALIRTIRARFGLTLLLVEHSMRVVMGVCERVVVLDHGVKIAEGPPDAVRAHPAVIEAYLGHDAAHH